MHPKIMKALNEPLMISITPYMVKKCLNSLPRANAYVQMAVLAETMQELSMINTFEHCLDDARRACHEFIDRIFDQEEVDHGF